jgi:serine/threonine protein kinase
MQELTKRHVFSHTPLTSKVESINMESLDVTMISSRGFNYGSVVEMEEQAGCEAITPNEQSAQEASSTTTKLTWDDLDLGELVGSGSFASVYRVKLRAGSPCLRLLSTTTTTASTSDYGSEDLLCELDLTFRDSSRRSTNSSTSLFASSRFALKRLKQETLSKPSDAKVASDGMRFEAALLSQILPHHANIIRMYAMSSDFFEKPASGFIILEYLGETLEERLKRWKNLKTIEKNSMTVVGSCQKFFDRRRGDGPEQWFRIKQIGLGVAEALRFLHHHSVLYRDLKPTNIGFDDTGRVRLFDFDLACLYKDEDTGKKLTSCVGSLRYMSPEVAKGGRYGFPADVHSFSLLLWEICTLQRPFTHARNAQQLAKMAFIGSERPLLRKVASPDIKHLLKHGWHPDPDARPSFASVVQVLRSHGTSCSRKSPK